MVGRLHHLAGRHARQPGRRAARAARPRRRGDPPGEDVLGRHAPAPRPGRQPGRRARRCSSSTSPPPASTRGAATICGTCCATSCATAPPSCSPRSTSKRPTAWPTTSSCSTTAAASPTARPTSSRRRSATTASRSRSVRRRELDAVTAAMQPFASNAANFDDELLVATVPVIEGVRLMDVMRALDAAGIDADRPEPPRGHPRRRVPRILTSPTRDERRGARMTVTTQASTSSTSRRLDADAHRRR